MRFGCSAWTAAGIPTTHSAVAAMKIGYACMTVSRLFNCRDWLLAHTIKPSCHQTSPRRNSSESTQLDAAYEYAPLALYARFPLGEWARRLCHRLCHPIIWEPGDCCYRSA